MYGWTINEFKLLVQKSKVYLECSLHTHCMSIVHLSHDSAVNSLGTHCTSQFSPSCVWRACNPMAGCFHVEELSSNLTSSTSRDSLRILINTFIHTAMMIIAFSHQVAIVLLCPGGGAGGLSRYHQHCSSGGNIAHCTRHIVVMNC